MLYILKTVHVIYLLQGLTVVQLKKLSQVIDDRMKKANEERALTETARDNIVKEIGNMLHESVPVSNDEVSLL